MEGARWNLAETIEWGAFDESKITDRQLHGIKMNSILEWSAMPTAEMFLRDSQHNSDFAAFMSIWFFEEQKHSLVLLEYLRRFAPEYLPTYEELSSVRFCFDPAPFDESLALHLCGEIRLNQWYRCAREWHDEKVIRQIYGLLSTDEARHARVYYEYMRQSIGRDAETARRSFAKIGVLMTNPRLNKAMHPVNLHVNKALYPNDTVNGRLPDTEWLGAWLTDEICFDKEWENKVVTAILRSYSGLFGEHIETPTQLRSIERRLVQEPVS